MWVHSFLGKKGKRHGIRKTGTSLPQIGWSALNKQRSWEAWKQTDSSHIYWALSCGTIHKVSTFAWPQRTCQTISAAELSLPQLKEKRWWCLHNFSLSWFRWLTGETPGNLRSGMAFQLSIPSAPPQKCHSTISLVRGFLTQWEIEDGLLYPKYYLVVTR